MKKYQPEQPYQIIVLIRLNGCVSMQAKIIGMPAACQRAKNEDPDFHLDQLFKKEGNAKAIKETPTSAASAPAQTIADAGLSLSFKRSASATTKKTKDDDDDVYSSVETREPRNNEIIVDVPISFDDEIFSGFQGAEVGFVPPPPPPTTLPCPPTLKELIANRQLRKTFTDLLLNKSGHRTGTRLENGGWIYQYTSGKSKGKFFFQPVENERRSSGSINLKDPIKIANARVIADVHTHPLSAYQQNNANSIEGAGGEVNLPRGYTTSPHYTDTSTGPSEADFDTATKNGLPGIVVYEAVKFGKGEESYVWFSGVGPQRVDNSGCK
jgi:hypothetical protein